MTLFVNVRDYQINQYQLASYMELQSCWIEKDIYMMKIVLLGDCNHKWTIALNVVVFLVDMLSRMGQMCDFFRKGHIAAVWFCSINICSAQSNNLQHPPCLCTSQSQSQSPTQVDIRP